MKSIGSEIRDILKRKRITLNRVAKDLGVTRESLYRSLLDGANPEWKRISTILDYLSYDFVLRRKRKEISRRTKRVRIKNKTSTRRKGRVASKMPKIEFNKRVIKAIKKRKKGVYQRFLK